MGHNLADAPATLIEMLALPVTGVDLHVDVWPPAKRNSVPHVADALCFRVALDNCTVPIKMGALIPDMSSSQRPIK